MNELLMDKMQVIALCLEIIGGTLTFLHIFKNDVSEKIAFFFDKFVKWSGIYVFEYGFSDKDDPLEISGFREFFKILFGIIIFVFLDFGDGFIWGFLCGILEFIVGMFLGMIVGIIFQIIFAMIFGSVLGSIKLFGKGDLIAGIGVYLMGFGIIIEIIQVWYGSLRWILSLILFAVILVIWILKIINEPTNDPWD